MKDLTDIQQRASTLVGLYSGRDGLYEELRKMFHMEWSDEPKGDWIKATMAPSAHNALLGAVRLMISTAPQFNVAYDEADAGTRETASQIEQAALAMWTGSGRATQRPPHYDQVFSALMYAEICAAVTRTADLVKYAEGSGDKAQRVRMKHLAVETPYLFTTFNPATCYGDFDLYGLRGMLRRTTTTWGEVQATWGALVQDDGQRRPEEKVVLNDWYDWAERAVWMDGADPIFHAEHGLAFMPVVDQLVEGTTLFDLPERQRLPFFYALHKSGLWKRENLSLTTIYSLIHALGSNPLLVYETDDRDNALLIDRTLPGGVLKINKGESLRSLAEVVVNPELYRGLEMAQRLNEESTIPKMALGAPPQQALAFSAISLLVQSGRLPLITTKQLGAEAIANQVRAALAWYKSDPPTGMKFYNARGGAIPLRPADLPERLALRVSLEPDLPTDKLQMANTGNALAASGLASTRWVRENILNIGQSEAMDKEIWMEKRLRFEIERLFQQLNAQDQLKLQQMAAQMQAVQQERSQAMAQTVAENEPAQDRANGGPPPSPVPPGGVGEGQPLNGPLPPRWQAG